MTLGASPCPANDRSSEIVEVAVVLDPVLVPLEFASAQIGASGSQGQVIYCRGLWDSTDGGCIDLVIDLVADPDCGTWRSIVGRHSPANWPIWRRTFPAS